MPRFGYLLPTRGSVLSSDDDPTLSAKADADVVGLASRAETMGFRAVWVGDSVLAKPRFEPLSTLAAVAGETEAVDLGTAVYLPPLRHPVNVAHAAATVDQLSGGRLVLGIGVGIGSDVEAEYADLDVPFGERGARLDEALEILAALWEGEPVDYDGSHYDLDGASIGFGPVGDVPIYAAAAAFDPSEGFPRSIRERIADHADGWIPTGGSPSTYAAAVENVRGILDDAGRDPDEFDHAAYLDVVIDGDPTAAIDEARDFYDRYYPAWDRLSDEQVEARGAFGPPEAVAETIEDYAEAGVERFVIRFPAGDQRRQLRRFGRLGFV